jgi:hypothetical protein
MGEIVEREKAHHLCTQSRNKNKNLGSLKCNLFLKRRKKEGVFIYKKEKKERKKSFLCVYMF